MSAQQSLELFQRRAELSGQPISERSQINLARQICLQMHGNPLYIRLAAARMFYEPLPMILQQLTGDSDDRRMQWRHGPRVGSEERHRGIGDVIAWSYELCADKQRLLFDRLSVFAPGHEVNPEDADTNVADVGAELETIEIICADDTAIDGCDAAPTIAGAAVQLARNEIRDVLEQLVDQSLVSIHMSADSTRYSLLESLRVFASERLAERSDDKLDEPARMAQRHCYYHRNKVLQLQAEWFGPTEQEMLNWAYRSWANIRRAIDHSLAAGEPEIGLQTCVGLLPLRASFYLNSLPEIRNRIEQALAATQASDPQLTELRSTAMALIAWLALVQGHPDAEELLEHCVAACIADAGQHWREQPEIDIGLPAVAELAWGAELMFVRADPRSITVLARAREKSRNIADRGGETMSGLHEALAAALFGSPEQALTITQRHLDWTTAAGAGWSQSWARVASAIAQTLHGDAEEALRLGRATLDYQVAFGDQWGPTWAIHVRVWALARLLADRIAAGSTDRSDLIKLATEIAYLAGGLNTQRARLGIVVENMTPVAGATNLAESVARDVVGPEIYAAAKKHGSQLAPERSELQRLALGTLSIQTPSRNNRVADSASSSWQTLSKVEQEVAILAAAGWPNSAIGARRGTSTKTTDAQIASIFQKLIINSRDDIDHYVPKNLRDQVSAERSHISRQSRDKPRSINARPQDSH
jgi:DNA-binding CsgD family transcriptional regulator